MGLLTKFCVSNNKVNAAVRLYSQVVQCKSHCCKVLVVGGGAGGCSVAWRLTRQLKSKDIIVLEPCTYHYCQPVFTLIAAGIRPFEKCRKPVHTVLPPDVRWLRDHAEVFEPCNNRIYTRNGDVIYYEYMVVAVGLKNDYDMIPGLKSCLDNPSSPVCSIYSPEYCGKTWWLLKQLKGGHAVFTFPHKAGKCSGAAQKIMYLADDYLRRNKLRNMTSITYNTGMEALFGVPKYAAALTRVADNRHITVNCCMNMTELKPHNAVFIDRSGEEIIFPYNFLHVTPPMSPPACLSECKSLVNEAGELDVHKHTLQHTSYHNVYGLGDCTNTPNSKTAAAVASQSNVLAQNLLAAVSGAEPAAAAYDGYGACLVCTSYRRGILAEFLYDKKICETFPFDQSKERRIFFYLMKHVLPYLYWNKLVKGKWNGNAKLRKIINPFNRN